MAILRATTLHIPVIICSIALGKKQGALVGLVFGFMSLIINTISPTVTSFVFSPFISGSVLSLAIAIIPRVCIGYVSGWLYEKLSNQKNFSIIFSAFIGSLTNTILVLMGIYVLFGDSYANALHQSFEKLLPYFLTIMATNGILEAMVGSIISYIVLKPLLKIVK